MGFDLYPLQTIESKKEYYARAIPEKWLTVFTHDPKIPWACVEKDETGKDDCEGGYMKSQANAREVLAA